MNITLPKLNLGEIYAGIILHEDGRMNHHLILLPAGIEDVAWDAAMKWAKAVGGELPLLYANCKARLREFLFFKQGKRDWYWSSEQHSAYSDCAWFHGFKNGLQDYSRKKSENRARAVRRVEIEK